MLDIAWPLRHFFADSGFTDRAQGRWWVQWPVHWGSPLGR